MVRLVIKCLDSPWAYELVPGLNKFGRNPTNDFRLADPSVSSFHAEVSVEPEAIRVRDLGSTNGTFIDGTKVEEGTIKPENILRLGNIRLQLEEVPVTPRFDMPTEISLPAASTDLPPPCAYHSAVAAAYRCANCGGGFCATCVTNLGQSKFGATTICPLCKGQCYALPAPQEQHEAEADQPSLLGRLSQTLKIPFGR